MHPIIFVAILHESVLSPTADHQPADMRLQQISKATLTVIRRINGLSLCDPRYGIRAFSNTTTCYRQHSLRFLFTDRWI
jgi:hypothetical protein